MPRKAFGRCETESLLSEALFQNLISAILTQIYKKENLSMDLKLKDDDESIEQDTGRLDDPSFNPESDFDPMAGSFVNNSVKTEVYDTRKVKASNGKLYKVLGIILLLAIIGGMAFGLHKWLFPEGKDVTYALGLPMNEFQAELMLTMDHSYDGAFIPNYYNGKVTASEDTFAKMRVFYYDGELAGYDTSSNRYAFYGITPGIGETHIDEKFTFPYDSSFTVLNDIGNGSSTTFFYTNSRDNTAVSITINDHSHRVSKVTYYNDLNKTIENLSF